MRGGRVPPTDQSRAGGYGAHAALTTAQAWGGGAGDTTGQAEPQTQPRSLKHRDPKSRHRGHCSSGPSPQGPCHCGGAPGSHPSSLLAHVGEKWGYSAPLLAHGRVDWASAPSLQALPLPRLSQPFLSAGVTQVSLLPAPACPCPSACPGQSRRVFPAAKSQLQNTEAGQPGPKEGQPPSPCPPQVTQQAWKRGDKEPSSTCQ